MIPKNYIILIFIQLMLILKNSHGIIQSKTLNQMQWGILP